MFFALWPDHALQLALANAAQRVVLACGGRAMPPENFHITLAFVGSVPASQVAKVEAVGYQVAIQVERGPVQLAMDAIEYWKKAGIVCAVAHEPQSTGALPSPGTAGALPRGTAGARPPATASARLADKLSTTLKSRLTAAGFTPDLKPFRAHVTLARKVSHPIPTMDMDAVVWRFTEFALVDSRTGPGGSAYRVLTSFPWGSNEGFDP